MSREELCDRRVPLLAGNVNQRRAVLLPRVHVLPIRVQPVQNLQVAVPRGDVDGCIALPNRRLRAVREPARVLCQVLHRHFPRPGADGAGKINSACIQ